MEQFKQNISSEDMQKDVPVLTKQKEILATSNHLAEVIEHSKDYLPESITTAYKEHYVALHKELMQIQRYLSAKEEKPQLEHDIEELLQQYPSADVSLSQKISTNAYYDRIISFFEQSGIPEEIYARAREAAEYLKEMILSSSRLREIAQEHPELN